MSQRRFEEWYLAFNSALQTKRPDLVGKVEASLRKLYKAGHTPEAAAAHIDHTTPPAPKQPLDAAHMLLQEALDKFPQFDTNEPVDRGDVVDWFGNWRSKVKRYLGGRGI